MFLVTERAFRKTFSIQRLPSLSFTMTVVMPGAFTFKNLFILTSRRHGLNNGQGEPKQGGSHHHYDLIFRESGRDKVWKHYSVPFRRLFNKQMTWGPVMTSPSWARLAAEAQVGSLIGFIWSRG